MFKNSTTKRYLSQGKRAQTPIHLLMILAIGFAVLVLLISNQHLYAVSFHQLEWNKAKATVDELANGARLVHEQGIGAKMRVYITIPKSVQQIQIQNTTIVLTFKSGENMLSVSENLGFSVTGYVDLSFEPHWVLIESKQGYVVIGNQTQNS